MTARGSSLFHLINVQMEAALPCLASQDKQSKAEQSRFLPLGVHSLEGTDCQEGHGQEGCGPKGSITERVKGSVRRFLNVSLSMQRTLTV